MVENDQIITELSYQSKQVEDILQENLKLKEESRTMRRKLSVLTQLEDELTKKNQTNQQIIKSLLEKLKCNYSLYCYS
jgi:regulator of replication initiation timing